ncbi:MAG: two pore domain potassium channel family protein [Bacillota bacterium]|nr:MAG: two pore domain potassium channel family protein [Bacillota bacterium]
MEGTPRETYPTVVVFDCFPWRRGTWLPSPARPRSRLQVTISPGSSVFHTRQPPPGLSREGCPESGSRAVDKSLRTFSLRAGAARGGIWWSIVTASTVGYGDISPATGAGRPVSRVSGATPRTRWVAGLSASRTP